MTALCVVAVTVPAMALAAIPQGEWKGFIVDEPRSKVTFEITSATKGKNFKATPVAVLCGIFPNSFLQTRTVVVPRLKVDGKLVAGVKTYKDGTGEVIGSVGMEGTLVRGKLKGTVRYDDANCSGEEEFVAKPK